MNVCGYEQLSLTIFDRVKNNKGCNGNIPAGESLSIMLQLGAAVVHPVADRGVVVSCSLAVSRVHGARTCGSKLLFSKGNYVSSDVIVSTFGRQQLPWGATRRALRHAFRSSRVAAALKLAEAELIPGKLCKQ